ncbi:HET-domain-containing protein [Colletotrichum falcatum]|nr:HET-domain-containing protein [Colletotrichum falcatum]
MYSEHQRKPDDVEKHIPAELQHMTDEEIQVGFQSSQACQRCLRYFHPELTGPSPDRHKVVTIADTPHPILHHNPDNLADGVKQDCWWCIRVFWAIQKLYGPMTIEHLLRTYPAFHSFSSGLDGWNRGNATCFLTWRMTESPMRDSMWFGRKDWARSPRGVYFKPDSTNMDPFEYLPRWMYRLGELGGNTGSQRTMEYIGAQIRKCMETHQGCRVSSKPTWYPRRLLQILSSNDQTAVTGFRLVETKETATHGPYATLSYCWGGKPNLTLTLANYQEYCITGMPACVIPQLFLDAAFVALKVGAGYIWIDSLCIIQDSKDDWIRESATMHNVYQYGLCNIMAASAGHSGEPLFNRRDVRLITPCIIPGPESGNMSTYVQGLEEINEEASWFENLGAEPLYRRGWVLQERLLSTRSAIFTRQNVYFQCPYGITREVHPEHSSTEPSLEFSDQRMIPSKFTPETCFETWRLIVNAYSKTELSFATDTLYALAGLAERVKELSGSQYLHGLWEADLAKGLAWWDETHERRHGFDAPSWSWACVQKPHYFDFSQSDAIPRTWVTPADGTLGLRGPMFSISTGSPSSPFDADMVQKEIMRRLEGAADRWDATAQFDAPENEEEGKTVPGDLLCVLLTKSHCRAEYMGILLAIVSVSNPTRSYRRIGFFRIDLSYNGVPSHVDTNAFWAPEITKRGRDFLDDCYGRLLDTLKSQPEDAHGLTCDGMTDEQTIFLV